MSLPTNPRKRALMPSSPLRRALRAAGHHLAPVVWVGKEGVSDAVLAALDVQLTAHELVKVKVSGESPEDRFLAAERLGEGTRAAVAQVLGRTVLVYRRHPEHPRFEAVLPGGSAPPAPSSEARRGPTPAARGGKRTQAKGGKRPPPKRAERGPPKGGERRWARFGERGPAKFGERGPAKFGGRGPARSGGRKPARFGQGKPAKGAGRGPPKGGKRGPGGRPKAR